MQVQKYGPEAKDSGPHIQMAKIKCVYCQDIIKGKVAYLNGKRLCSKCFNELRGWNPRFQNHESDYRKTTFIASRIESIRKKYADSN